jgi:hypothetical protein
MTPRARRPVRLAAGLSACAAMAGCTVPITSQTITSGALNAGALFFVDRHNNEGEDAYRYHAAVDADQLAATFEAAVEEANHAHLFPPARPKGHQVAEGPRPGGADAAEFVSAGAGHAERADPKRPSRRIPDRQWTPAPLFDVEPGSPTARGDTLVWIVTHRATRRVAFLLVPKAGATATKVVIAPYDPPADALLSVPSDHAQRNAVEALHQAFYLAAVARFGPGVFVDGPEADADAGDFGGGP